MIDSYLDPSERDFDLPKFLGWDISLVFPVVIIVFLDRLELKNFEPKPGRV